MTFDRFRSIGVMIFFCSLVAGCETIPPRAVEVLPAPAHNFPLPKNAIVRMPILITFSDKGGLVQPLADLFKIGTLKLMPYVDAIPGFKGRLRGLWKELQKPIFIDRDVWLTIHPMALGVGRMRSDPQRPRTAHTVLEMVARPELTFGKQPPVVLKVMPPLMPFQPGPAVFEATSNLRLSYDEANAYLKDPKTGILGKVVKGTGNRKVVLRGIRFYGSGGKVIVEVKLDYQPFLINLSGHPGHLTLYLSGTPRYRDPERVFEFPDLSFDIKTNDFLLHVANWVLKSGIQDELRKVTRLPVGQKSDQLKARMNIVLNRPIEKMGRLDTKVQTFAVTDGFADNDGIEARVKLKGTAVMELNWN